MNTLNTLRDREAVIGAWLDDGPASLPSETRQAIVVGIRTTRRRRQGIGLPFGLGRLGFPNLELRRLSVALGVVALLAVAGVVVTNLPGRPNLVGAAPLPTSPADWSRVLIDSAPDSPVIMRIAAGPRGLVATTARQDSLVGPLFASTDGYNWSRAERSSGVRATVVATESGFLMLDDGVWTSEDGSDWQRVVSVSNDSELAEGTVFAAAAGGPGFVAVGSNNKAWYSIDGFDWSMGEVPPPPAEYVDRTDYPNLTVDLGGIAVAGDNLVAWGYVGADNGVEVIGRGFLLASTDGRTWSTAAVPWFGGEAVGITGGPDGFLAIGLTDFGAGYGVWSSVDGQAWQLVASDPFGTNSSDDDQDLDAFVSGLAASPAGYVAVGGGRERACNSRDHCRSIAVVVWTSEDGRTWSRLPSDGLFTSRDAEDSLYVDAGSVLAWGSRFVIGGEYESQPAIWISNPAPSGLGAIGSAAPPQETPTPAGTGEPSPTPASEGQPAAFAGNWEATDIDDSHQTMEVFAQPDGAYDVTILDDAALVCSTVSSTMTGVAVADEPGRLVIAQPVYLCDDGSEPRDPSGPLDEKLKNLTFRYDHRIDALYDSLGLVWRRVEIGQ